MSDFVVGKEWWVDVRKKKSNEKKVKLFLTNIKIHIFLMISEVKCVFFYSVYAMKCHDMVICYTNLVVQMNTKQSNIFF